METGSALIDYFDAVRIIHLPERRDRFVALSRELQRLGVEMPHAKVQVPYAPRPDEACGFPSRGVYGNFLSHYGILHEACRDGLETVWVLEDDAIFSRRMIRIQPALVATLESTAWDLCFFGHSLDTELVGMPRGLVPHTAPFRWAHCYAVHRRVLPRLLAYMEETQANPPGHARGGRMYIDGVYSQFRRLHPDVLTLVANPVLSAQKGSPSSLAARRWYDRVDVLRPAVSTLRRCRDAYWRLTA